MKKNYLTGHNLENLRKYGKQPYNVVLVHGGPGAAGEMAQVALELSHRFGILEPLQTEKNVDGLLDELKNVFEKYADFPVTLVGFSWGAWLSLIFTSKYSELISKLILISSGPFEQKYAENIMDVRLSRLSKDERIKFELFLRDLESTKVQNRNAAFARLGKLISKSDAYEPIEYTDEINCDYDIFRNVWEQASELRKSGELLNYAKKIKCPVIAIHGDYDPHPSEGVEEPLSKYIDDFHFYLLKNCGHKPWIEKHAKDKFYEILKREL